MMRNVKKMNNSVDLEIDLDLVRSTGYGFPFSVLILCYVHHVSYAFENKLNLTSTEWCARLGLFQFNEGKRETNRRKLDR